MNVAKQETAGIKQEEGPNATLDLPRDNDRKRKAISISQKGSTSDEDNDDVIFVETKKVKDTPADHVEVLDLS